MVKPIYASGPHFTARTATTGISGLRALLEAPPDAPGTAAATTAPTAPAVITKPLKDEIGDILRAELPKAVGEHFAGERAASLEKITKLDETVAKLGTDFARFYQAASQNPVGGADGLAERDLVMRPHESVDGWLERHQVMSGSLMFSGSSHRGSGGIRMGGGRGVGLAGVHDQRGIGFARMVRAYAAAERERGFSSGDASDAAATFALKRWNDKHTADMIKETAELQKKLTSGTADERVAAERSLGTSTIGSGGAFIKPDFASFFMEYLFAQVVVMDLGAMTIPFKTELSVPFLDVAITAAFRQEATGPNAQQFGDNYLQFSRKIITAIAAMTNEWLYEADYSPDVVLRNHMAKAIAVAADLRMLRGRGTASEIRGADYWVENAGSTHFFNRTKDAGSGFATYKTILHDLIDVMRIITGENIALQKGKPGYVLQNDTFYALMRVLSGTALELSPFRDELRAGSLQGAPVKVTTQLPVNQAGDGAGSGTNNKTNTYFGDWSTFAVAQNGGIEIKAMDGAAYKDLNGTTQAGFTNNETVIRADWKLDTGALYRGKELTRIDSSDWHVAF